MRERRPTQGSLSPGWILLGLAFMAIRPSGGAAQPIELQPAELLRYDMVRLQAPAGGRGTVIGRVIEADSLRLVVLSQEDYRLVIPLEEIDRLDVLLGRNRLGPAMLGFAAGAVAGWFAVKVYLDQEYKAPNDEWNGVVGVILGAPIGGLVGAGRGALLGGHEWQTVRIGFTAGPAGVNAGRFGLRADVMWRKPPGGRVR